MNFGVALSGGGAVVVSALEVIKGLGGVVFFGCFDGHEVHAVVGLFMAVGLGFDVVGCSFALGVCAAHDVCSFVFDLRLDCEIIVSVMK